MNKVTVERGREFKFTLKEAQLFMSSWYRVVDKDGSTIAYAPDKVTAMQIADLFNGKEPADE